MRGVIVSWTRQWNNVTIFQPFEYKYRSAAVSIAVTCHQYARAVRPYLSPILTIASSYSSHRLFAPNDPDVPMSLKARIGKWKDSPPSSQFQQYGPLNKYFNRKFKRDTHMTKPQSIFRQPIDEEDNLLLLEWGDGSSREDSELPEDDPELRARIIALRQERDAGNITIDSTNGESHLLFNHTGSIDFCHRLCVEVQRS